MPKKPKEPIWSEAGGFTAWMEFMFAMGGNPFKGFKKKK